LSRSAEALNQEYRKQAAPAGGYAPDQSSYIGEVRNSQVMRLRNDFADMAKLYSFATRMPDEVLHDTGFDIPCYVVRVTNADRKSPKTSEESMTDTLWIDQQTMVVLRRERHEDAFAVAGRVNTPIAIDSITRYSTVQLTAPVPRALFHFHPPADAELVTKFSDRLFGLDLTGQSAPDIRLSLPMARACRCYRIAASRCSSISGQPGANPASRAFPSSPSLQRKPRPKAWCC